MLTNEVFGEENFIAVRVWQKACTSNMTAKHGSETHDYVVVYARDDELKQSDASMRDLVRPMTQRPLRGRIEDTYDKIDPIEFD